jgi:hypothetical protein
VRAFFTAVDKSRPFVKLVECKHFPLQGRWSFIDDYGEHFFDYMKVFRLFFCPPASLSFTIGIGNTNTTTIVGVQGAGSYTAKVYDDIVVNKYDNWLLSSRDEVEMMYHNLAEQGLGGFSTVVYWISSEYSFYEALSYSFSAGTYDHTLKLFTLYVRVARVF